MSVRSALSSPRFCWRRRIVSSSVTSARSCWVTCGITAQASDRCSALRRRIPRSGSRSTGPHCSNRGSGGSATGPARGRGGLDAGGGRARPGRPPAARTPASLARLAAPGRPARGGPDVVVGDPPARTGPADPAEVHAQLAREPARRGRGGRRQPGRGRGRGRSGRRTGSGRRARRPSRGRAGAAGAAAGDGAPGVGEAQEDRADLDPLPGLDVDPVDPPAERRGQLDLRLLGLDHEDGLVLLDLLPLRDQDADDLRLGEAFPEIGQPEVSRHWRAGAAGRTPARRRASPGPRAARDPARAASRAPARSPGRRCRRR